MSILDATDIAVKQTLTVRRMVLRFVRMHDSRVDRLLCGFKPMEELKDEVKQ
jgi:hypothetical protein